MPIEGLADPKLHRLCVRCRKWFNPDEGVLDFPSATGPIGFIMGMSARVADDESKMKFYCLACHATRKKRKSSALTTILSLTAAAGAIGGLWYSGQLERWFNALMSGM